MARATVVDRVLGRLEEAGAEALNLNLACNAKLIRSCAAGSALFENFEALRTVLHEPSGNGQELHSRFLRSDPPP